MVYLQLALFMVSQVELLFHRRNMHFQLIIAAGCSQVQISGAHPDLLKFQIYCTLKYSCSLQRGAVQCTVQYSLVQFSLVLCIAVN